MPLSLQAVGSIRISVTIHPPRWRRRGRVAYVAALTTSASCLCWRFDTRPVRGSHSLYCSSRLRWCACIFGLLLGLQIFAFVSLLLWFVWPFRTLRVGDAIKRIFSGYIVLPSRLCLTVTKRPVRPFIPYAYAAFHFFRCEWTFHFGGLVYDRGGTCRPAHFAHVITSSTIHAARVHAFRALSLCALFCARLMFAHFRCFLLFQRCLDLHFRVCSSAFTLG